jgi:hypothetical protein
MTRLTSQNLIGISDDSRREPEEERGALALAQSPPAPATFAKPLDPNRPIREADIKPSDWNVRFSPVGSIGPR